MSELSRVPVNVALLRQRLHMTPRQLARVLKTSVAIVNRIESGDWHYPKYEARLQELWSLAPHILARRAKPNWDL